MFVRVAILLAGVVLLWGCAGPQVEILSRTAMYPPSRDVEVMLDLPARAHKVFAILEDRSGGTPEEINARLAARGAEIGADAVVITGINDKTVTEWVVIDPCFHDRLCWPHYRPVRFTYRSVRAKAVKYTAP